jgi:hypothetical protein
MDTAIAEDQSNSLCNVCWEAYRYYGFERFQDGGEYLPMDVTEYRAGFGSVFVTKSSERAI